MLSSPNTEVLRDGIEAPSTESFPVMKTLTTRTYNTSIQLSPNSSFPTSLEVDTLEKYHPLAVGGPDSVSMGVGICSNDGENIETVNVHIKNGDLVFLDETPKLVKQNESTNVYKVGDVKFVTPSMDIRDFFAQLTRDRAYVGNPELSKFLQ